MQAIIAAVLPVFFTVAVGYWLARRQKPFHTETIAFLSSEIGTPALVFTSLVKLDVDPSIFQTLAIATVLCLALFFVIAVAALKAARIPIRTYLPAMMFPNTGNLGLPLALYAYGQTGLSFAVIVFVVVSICNLLVGQAIAAGTANWRGVVTSPMVIAVVLGVTGALVGITLPVWLDNVLTMLSGLTIPLMLLMLGTSLAKFPVRASWFTIGLSALRIFMGIAVGFGVAAVFGFTGVERAVLVLQCAMPVAVYNYLFAVLWKTEPERIAALVVISTLMAMVTIPILLGVLT